MFSEKAKRPLSNDYTFLSDVSRFDSCLTQSGSEYRAHSQPSHVNITILVANESSLGMIAKSTSVTGWFLNNFGKSIIQSILYLRNQPNHFYNKNQVPSPRLFIINWPVLKRDVYKCGILLMKL